MDVEQHKKQMMQAMDALVALAQAAMRQLDGREAVRRAMASDEALEHIRTLVELLPAGKTNELVERQAEILGNAIENILREVPIEEPMRVCIDRIYAMKGIKK